MENLGVFLFLLPCFLIAFVFLLLFCCDFSLFLCICTDFCPLFFPVISLFFTVVLWILSLFLFVLCLFGGAPFFHVFSTGLELVINKGENHTLTDYFMILLQLKLENNSRQPAYIIKVNSFVINPVIKTVTGSWFSAQSLGFFFHSTYWDRPNVARLFFPLQSSTT